MQTGTGTGSGTFEPLQDDDPRTVGPYRLMARLGSGGMGRVYLSHTPGGRPVAVKVIRPELADDADFRDRFRQEVANARRVQGVCTAPVLDSDTEGLVPWLATAYVSGPSLADAVKQHGPLPRETVLLLTAGVAEALQDIHRAGVVHRDLKPSNVLLAVDGPRVIDFGVARAVDATSLTRSGSAIGTPAFMAPEQALGGEITGATDVFALGQIAAFAATGSGAFGDGPSHGVLYRIVHEDPQLGELPDYLAELVAGCLHKEPQRRLTPAEVVRLCAAADPEGDLRRADSWLPASVAGQLAQHAAGEPEPPRPDTMALRVTPPGALGQGVAPPRQGATGGVFGPPAAGGFPGGMYGTPAVPGPAAPGSTGFPGGAYGAPGEYAPTSAPYAATSGAGVAAHSAPTGPVVTATRRRARRTGLIAGGAVVLTAATVTGALYLSGVLRPGGQDTASGQPGPDASPTAEQHPTGSDQPSASASKKPAAERKPHPSASPSRSTPPASAEPAAPQPSATSRKPTATAPAQPVPVGYSGLRMTASHDLYLGDSPVGPKADTGSSDEDLTYAVYSSGAVVAPGSTSRSQLTRLAPRAAGTLDSCLAQTGSEKYVWVRDLAVGDRLCVISGTGHVGLVTFRGTAPSPDATDYITVDVRVWRNAVDPVSG
ncbi:protein kinase [Streptomyces sp. NPDC057136]|uniref:serine/threonine-protein kinase n=1 Tax=Streptomyces sp. NPDC057136 TaxID=3346029 RepID=UPI0036445148